MPTPIFNSQLLSQGVNQIVVTTPTQAGYGIMTCRVINHNAIDALVDIYATNSVSSPAISTAIAYQHTIPANSQETFDTIILPQQQSIVARSSIANVSISITGLYYHTRNSFVQENSILLSTSNVIDISHVLPDTQYGVSYITVYNYDNIAATLSVYLSNDTVLNNSKMILKDISVPSKTYTHVTKGLIVPIDYKIYIETNSPNLIARSTLIMEQ